jgi:DNA-binding response OmpR family regulator/voltage-gated potassium channel Kch
VCGYSEIGSAICDELKDQRLLFVVVTDNEGCVAEIEREGHALVRGNPTTDASLKDAGIDRAVGVIAVLPDDADNLFISLAARELNPKIFIISRGKDASVEDRILRAGADIVVSPLKLGGQQIAELIKQRAGASSYVGGVIDQAAATGASVLGMRLSTYQHASENPTTVATVLEKYRAIAAAGLQRRDGTFLSHPAPAEDVFHDDVLVLITRTEESVNRFHNQSRFNEPLTSKVILLADDHRALRLLFSRKLAAVGHDVIQAATGEEALRLARSRIPDLVVLDVNMPLRNGYQVCKELRQDPQFSAVPIMLYSGEETDEFISRGRESGADMCIRKTSKSSELLARIEEVLSKPRPASLDPQASAATAARVSGTSPDPSSSIHVFDREVLLQNVDGDPQLMADVISTMLEETPQIMNRMQDAIARVDANAVQREAHTLKSSAILVGATAAVAAAEELESAGRNADLDSFGELYAELNARTEAMLISIQTSVTEV